MIFNVFFWHCVLEWQVWASLGEYSPVFHLTLLKLDQFYNWQLTRQPLPRLLSLSHMRNETFRLMDINSWCTITEQGLPDFKLQGSIEKAGYTVNLHSLHLVSHGTLFFYCVARLWLEECVSTRDIDWHLPYTHWQQTNKNVVDQTFSGQRYTVAKYLLRFPVQTQCDRPHTHPAQLEKPPIFVGVLLPFQQSCENSHSLYRVWVKEQGFMIRVVGCVYVFQRLLPCKRQGVDSIDAWNRTSVVLCFITAIFSLSAEKVKSLLVSTLYWGAHNNIRNSSI